MVLFVPFISNKPDTDIFILCIWTEKVWHFVLIIFYNILQLALGLVITSNLYREIVLSISIDMMAKEMKFFNFHVLYIYIILYMYIYIYILSYIYISNILLDCC